VFNQEFASYVIDECRKNNKIVAVDPKPANPLNWAGSTIVKPNRAEAFAWAGLPYAETEEALLEAARLLQKKWAPRYLLITLGEEGMMLLEEGKKPHHTPNRAREVFDVSGAGDTSVAVFVLALAAGATGMEAAELANHAGGVVVGKLGTATATLAELRESFNNHGI
jgi:D-beta-D-heptose 7-phosphate kinase/D-beta-D-heptose 1-phosphate adenosyltransferase